MFLTETQWGGPSDEVCDPPVNVHVCSQGEMLSYDALSSQLHPSHAFSFHKRPIVCLTKVFLCFQGPKEHTLTMPEMSSVHLCEGAVFPDTCHSLSSAFWKSAECSQSSFVVHASESKPTRPRIYGSKHVKPRLPMN